LCDRLQHSDYITFQLIMNTKILFVGTIVLSLLGNAIAPQIAQARWFKNSSVRCYFFKGETLAMEETCKSDGASWAGGGGHSLKWSDGITTQIKFGLQGRGTPACPIEGQISVDDKCGKVYLRSANSFRRVKNANGKVIECVQLDRKSVCWGSFSD
jgi:hypothetical protein